MDIEFIKLRSKCTFCKRKRPLKLRIYQGNGKIMYCTDCIQKPTLLNIFVTSTGLSRNLIGS